MITVDAHTFYMTFIMLLIGGVIALLLYSVWDEYRSRKRIEQHQKELDEIDDWTELNG